MGSFIPDDFTRSLRMSPLKTHIEYDLEGRTSLVYEANHNAKNNDPCLVTQYIYQGVTTKVVGTKEALSNWDTSWDSSFTV